MNKKITLILTVFILSGLNLHINSENQSNNNLIYYISVVDCLRFRKSPGLNGENIRSLKKSDKLKLIEKGKEETINGLKGNWIKVQAVDNQEGWCFDPYLILESNIKDKEELIWSSENGYFYRVKYLLENNYFDVNIKTLYSVGWGDLKDYTLLMAASRGGQFEIVKYLVEKGAKVNSIASGGDVNQSMYYSALSEACNNKANIDIVKYLIEKGADINIIVSREDVNYDGSKFVNKKLLDSLKEDVNWAKEKLVKENKEEWKQLLLDLNKIIEILQKAGAK